MPLSWNEIKDRALAFSREWADESRETAESQTFWNQFFEIFGLTRRRIASFEEPVKKLAGRGEIDLFWKGVLIAEHKSRGKNLDRAHQQALDYFPGIAERDLPRYVLVSDFARMRLHDLETGEGHEFALADLHKNVALFAFVAGYSTQKLAPEDPVNRKAAERMGRLHDQLKASGYEGHPLELLLVRLLFCLFAEDTGIFQPRKCFQDWIESRTASDGSNLGALLAQFFQALNTPNEKRSKALDEQLAAFPYVNGKLFEEPLPIADFNSAMREALLDACALDWSQISPAIFGALFQSIMDEKARRNLGAHYTSERNILKLIKPLFLDELRVEFERIKNNRNKLFDFHKKLRSLTFFDPACGCGNFLVVAYRELRLLELDVLRASRSGAGQRDIDAHSLTQIDVDQFYGIEIEEFPAQIAQVALWLTDHQMNLKISEEFGLYFARIPLKSTPHIVYGNALRLDWDDVLPSERCSYVMGNPPFVGKHYRTPVQRDEQLSAMSDIKAAADLDFVAAWYVKAVRYMQFTTRAAFVSTNSISQGEQVPLLWGWMLAQGVSIHFAHRTFQWSNEGGGIAAVHCVIVGFGREDVAHKRLYTYQHLKGEPLLEVAQNINPYLLAAPTVLVAKRQQPSWPSAPTMRCGNKPSDGGHLILNAEEKTALLKREPEAARYIRRFIGSEEYINGIERYCLWLPDAKPEQLRKLPLVMARVEAVRAFRMASTAAPTRKAAETPSRFFFISQPSTPYILVPEVSSERRRYVPIGWMPPEIISSNKNYLIAEPSLYLLGVLQSTMHMEWMRACAGRLKSDFQYSGTMVYNTFPWPIDATDKQRAAIETAAQAVLDTRAQFPGSSLADLYDPLTMPAALLKTHQTLDRAVDAAYGRKSFSSDAERVAFLFEQYQKLTNLLPVIKASKARRKKSA